MEEQKNTEQMILEAAKSVFLDKGYDAAKMQDISDKAGINKAMLHYYYRSKQKLFERVIEEILSFFIPKLIEVLTSEDEFDIKIKKIVNTYIDLMIDNPQFPLFVLRELNNNTEAFTRKIKSIFPINIFKNNLLSIINNFNQDKSKESIDAMQFIITLFGSCIFPALAKNFLIHIFNFSEADYIEFMNNRKNQLPELLIKGIK